MRSKHQDETKSLSEPSLIRNEEDGIYCHSSCGPVFSTFGLRHDLCISDNANTSPSNSYVGTAFELPPGQKGTFLTGAEHFTVNYQAGEINSYN